MDAIHAACPRGDVARGWDDLPEPHRAVFVGYWVLAENDNGGLEQYFWNSAGDFAAQLPGAARLFGAERYANLFERALAPFDSDRVGDRRYRQERRDELGVDAFDALTDELYALEDCGVSLWAAMLRCVEAHPATFFTEDS
jgi:Domain of unknown function (DUF4375)